MEDIVIATPRLTAPTKATVSDPVKAVRPNTKNTQVANTRVVLVRSVLDVLETRLRVLVMSEGFTVEQANKPEPVNDVDMATVSDFGIKTPADWEGVGSPLAWKGGPVPDPGPSPPVAWPLAQQA
ncbi:hypothetical protein ACFVJR_08600 [Nocardia salmonicida]|uniref:hypothetical protein n=1 Tax=Nocardia salmonicida TaxID=53431 RepID=UPI00363632BD